MTWPVRNDYFKNVTVLGLEEFERPSIDYYLARVDGLGENGESRAAEVMCDGFSELNADDESLDFHKYSEELGQ